MSEWNPMPSNDQIAGWLNERLSRGESLLELYRQIQQNTLDCGPWPSSISLPLHPTMTYEQFSVSAEKNCFYTAALYVTKYDPTFIPVDTYLPNKRGTAYNLFCEVVRRDGHRLGGRIYFPRDVWINRPSGILLIEKFILTMVYLRREYEALCVAMAIPIRWVGMPCLVEHMTTLDISPPVDDLVSHEAEYDLAQGLHQMAIGINLAMAPEPQMDIVGQFSDWTIMDK